MMSKTRTEVLRKDIESLLQDIQASEDRTDYLVGEMLKLKRELAELEADNGRNVD